MGLRRLRGGWWRLLIKGSEVFIVVGGSCIGLINEYDSLEKGV